MSIHPSLRGADALKGDRSVLTRFERIQKLSRDGKLDPESGSALGLPKVRTKFKVAKAKKAEGEPAPAGTEGEAAETPAEGAAPQES